MKHAPALRHVPIFTTLALAVALAGCGTKPPPGVKLVPITFDVAAPIDTPATTTVAIVGSSPNLGSDALPGFHLHRAGGTHFRGTASLPAGEEITYNARLASGGTELDDSFSPTEPRTLKVGDSGALVTLSVAHWDTAPDPSAPAVTFVVQVPHNTPPDDPIWISGNQDALGMWNGAGAKLAKRPDGYYATRLNFPIGTSLEFKVTRGSWDTVEKGAGGEEVANHTFVVEATSDTISVTVANWRDLSSDPGPTPVLTGNIQYLRAVHSAFLAHDRDVIIYLPPDYNTATTRHYPVLYMHDGQNLMDASTSFTGVEWGVDEAAERLIQANQMEAIIIVGIYSTSDRISEYTQVPDPRYGGGNATKYGQFLTTELKPMIDTMFRTKPEAQYTGIAGSSLGGLISMYFGLTLSDTFDRLGVISPSVWWAQKDIVTRVSGLPAKLPLRIWEDIGTLEGSTPQEEVDNARALRDALIGRGWALNTDLSYLEVSGAHHDERAWSARADQILTFLYPP